MARQLSSKDHPDPPARLLDTDEFTKWSFYRAVIAEFIATLLFLYIGVLTVIGHKSQTDHIGECAGVGILGIASAFGGTIFVLVYCTGGHINPAVTFGLFLARKVSLNRAVMYMVAQFLGAICGVALVKAYQKSYYDRYGGGANVLEPAYSKGVGLAAEIIGTFVLVYTVFSATDPKITLVTELSDSLSETTYVVSKHAIKALAPLSIGFAVFLVHLATIPITGTGINPARSLGAAIVYNKPKAWHGHWIFWVGPFTGAAIATLYHQYVSPYKEEKKPSWRNSPFDSRD